MNSTETIAGLEERDPAYILGTRERTSKEVRDVVLADAAPFTAITVPREKHPDTEREANRVWLGRGQAGRR